MPHMTVQQCWYGLLHLECHVVSISNLKLLGFFSTERGKRDELDYRLRFEYEEMTLQMQ